MLANKLSPRAPDNTGSLVSAFIPALVEQRLYSLVIQKLSVIGIGFGSNGRVIARIANLIFGFHHQVFDGVFVRRARHRLLHEQVWSADDILIVP